MSVPAGADLNDIPAGVPPPGITSNLIDPPSLQTATIAIFSTLIAVSSLFVITRVWFYVTYTRRLMTDDIFTILSWIFSAAQSGIVLSTSKTERHQWDLPLAWYDASYFKRSYAQSVIAWPAIFFAKAAILFLFRRVFGVRAYMHVCIWIGLVWATITYIPNIFVNSYYCAPHVGEQWTIQIGERCSAPLKWEIASATMSIMLDIFILVIPIPLILKLRMSTGRKVGILSLFSVASLAVVCAVLTLVFRIRIFLNYNNGDSSWATAQLEICNGAENYTAIIVGCVPGVSSFFRIYVAESRLYSTIANSLLSRLAPSSISGNSKHRIENSDETKAKRQRKHSQWSLFDTTRVTTTTPTELRRFKYQRGYDGEEYLELRDAENLISSAPPDQYQHQQHLETRLSNTDIRAGSEIVSTPE